MALHRIYFHGELSTGVITISGDEAHHAVRVKRLEQGDALVVLDGRGHAADAVISQVRRDKDGWSLALNVNKVETTAPVSPRIEVCSAAPKGPRLADMIEGLSQAGAASWRYLDTDHGAVEPRPAKLDRLVRTAAESSKQCGRAWLLEIGEPISFDEAIAHGPDTAVVLADASGKPYQRSGARTIRLLIGPEGGWSARELAKATDITIARFGPHAMRIETAAVMATGITWDGAARPLES